MANAYRYQTAGNNPGGIPFTKKQMLEDLALFLAYDASWTVHKGTYTYDIGDVPDPENYIVFEHDNGTPGDEVVIHIWERTLTMFGLNISTGPWVNTATWKAQPGARYGEAADSEADKYYCRTRFSSSSLLEYYFFGYASYVYVVYRGDNDIWRSFAFGHIDKLTDFNGGGFCCATYGTNDDNWVDRANQGAHTVTFDLYGPNAQDTDGEYHCSQVRVDKPNGDLRYILGCQRYFWINLGDADLSRMFGVNDVISSGGMMYSNQNSDNWWVSGFEHNKLSRSPTDFSNEEILVPVYVYMYRSDRSKRREAWSDGEQRLGLVGQLPHCLGIRLNNLSPGQEIDVQGSTYTVFPYARKTGTNDTNDGVVNSGNYGFILEKLET